MGRTDFKTPSSEYEVRGKYIRAILSAFSIDFLSEELLKRFDLYPLDDDAWYPLQSYLSLLERIHDRMFVMLEAVGRKVFQHTFPQDIENFEKVLEVMNKYYQESHRHKEGKAINVGRYDYTKVREGEFLIESSTVYPCTYEIGIIKGIAKYYKESLSIEHDDERCRSKGDSVCVYKIKIH